MKTPTPFTRLTNLRFLNFVLLFALVGTLFLHFTLAASAGWHYPDEADFVNRINSRRGSIGLNGLYWSGCLTNAAREHAKAMSDRNSVYHSDLGSLVTRHCGDYGYAVGENVGGFHSSVASAWNQYMASPCHQANIDSRTFSYPPCSITGGYGTRPWTHVGVGSWRRADSTIASVQLFVYAPDTRYGNFNQAVNAHPSPSYSSSTAPTTNWSGWENLQGVMQPGTTPTAASWDANRIDVFVQGTTNDLFQKYWNGSGWHGFYNLGGKEVMAPNSSPAAISWGPNRIDIFARSKSDTLIHKWWDGARWSGWEDLGGIIASAPAVSSWASGRLDVFARGSNGALYHKAYSRGWHNWENLGGGIKGAPTAVSWGADRIDVFVRGTNDGVHQKAWTGSGWSDWANHGGVINEAPGVASWGTNRLDVFVRGTTNSVYQKYWSGSWSGWTRLDTQSLTSGLAAVSKETNRVDIFARGPNGELLHKWYPR